MVLGAPVAGVAWLSWLAESMLASREVESPFCLSWLFNLCLAGEDESLLP